MNTAGKVVIFCLELIIWLLSIGLGSYLGGISIGFAGALTVGILCYGFQEPVGQIPWDVLQIILSVVCLSAAVEAAGGMEYLVRLAERILRSQPKYVTFLAPAVVWAMTIVCGTGYIFFAVLPVVATVAKSVGIRPARPLTTASLAAMFAVIASPLSSSMVIISEASEAYGRKFSYLGLVGIFLPSTLIALMLTAVYVARMGPDLWDDPEFLRRYREGLVSGVVGGRPVDKDLEMMVTELDEPPSYGPSTASSIARTPFGSASSGTETAKDLIPHERPPLRPRARLSVAIFSFGMLGAMTYAIIYSRLHSLRDLPTNIGEGIVIFTLSTSLVISMACKVSPESIVDAPLFKHGVVAAISVLGIAWAGSTVVESHLAQMSEVAEDWIRSQSWVVAVVCFFMASLILSQAAAARVFIPVAFSMGVSAYECVIAYACCSTVYLLPASPGIVNAISLDDCGTTKAGKYVFDHTMMIPGLMNTFFTVALVAFLAYLVGGSASLEPSFPSNPIDT